MGTSESMTLKAAGAFRKVRRFFPTETRLFLLKRGEHTSEFTEITEVTESWFVNYNDYREQMQFEIATTDADFLDYAAQASFIGYGVPDDDEKIEVYVIPDDARDKVPPTGPSPTWKLFGVREANERYTVV